MTILVQTEKDFELLLIDDQSTDRLTLEILRTFANFDSRINIIRTEKRSGQSGSRNLGIDNANGEYIIFLDHDDLFHNELIGKMSQTLDETDADLCITDFIMKDIVTDETSIFYSKRIDGVTDRPFNLKELGDDGLNYWMSVPWNRMIRMDLIKNENLRFLEIPCCEDTAFCAETDMLAEKIVYCKGNDPLIVYRVNNQGQQSYNMDSRYFVTAYKYLLSKECYTSNPIFLRQILKRMLDECNPFMSRCPNEEYNLYCKKEIENLYRQYSIKE